PGRLSGGAPRLRRRDRTDSILWAAGDLELRRRSHVVRQQALPVQRAARGRDATGWMAPHHLHHRMRSADPNVGLRAAGTADRAVFLRRRGLRVLIATETRAASGRLLFRGCDPAQGRLVNRPRGATCDAGSLLHLLPEPVHRHEGYYPGPIWWFWRLLSLSLVLPRLK